MRRTRLWPLLPLVPVYGVLQALESMAYERGWRRVERLTWPVVSIGNLSVGGAGKTPLVIALARALTDCGWQVDVLSRGYGRTSRAVEQVDLNAGGDPAARYGDEPWLIAQAAQVPVFVGADRATAGRLAEQTAGTVRCVHLLDDGMQHRRLARDVEIVVLHRSDLETSLLPAGRLREPLAALRRADFVILREEDEELAQCFQRWLHPGAGVWRVRRALEVPTLPGPAVVFSAIAHPDEFVQSLHTQGVVVATEQAWRDHHRYTEADLASLRRKLLQSGAGCFLTTEKDAARLSAAQRATLEDAAPLVVARLTAHLLDQQTAIEALVVRLAHAVSAPAL